MSDLITLYIEHAGWVVLVALPSLIVLMAIAIEFDHRIGSHSPRRKLAGMLAAAFLSGAQRGLRGYFAMLHLSPWRAALQAWWHEIQRISNGPGPCQGDASANESDPAGPPQKG